MRRLGVIINPYAGKGVKKEVVISVLKRLKSSEIFAPRGKLGSKYIKNSTFRLKEIEVDMKGSREDTERVIEEFNLVELDAVVVFGGDGTMSDASHSKHPLLCIPTGSTNVSPLMTSQENIGEIIEKLTPEKLKVEWVDGLRIRLNGDEFQAFNDVVIGSTIISTVGEKRTQIDAFKFIHGVKATAKPKKFRARVRVGEKEVRGVFGNIFVSPADKRYLGKGIAGGAAMSVFLGFDAIIALTEEPMIYHYTKDEFRELEPFVTKTLSFDEGETVRIEAEEVISRDGTPLKKLDSPAYIDFRRKLVRVFKL